MLRILLVDDETLVRNHIKKLICWEKEGFEVTGEESNGYDAFRFVEGNQVDIVLLDIKMPVMDGIEFLKKLKANANNPKVIILSSYEDFSYAREAMRLGAVNYLLKHTLDAGTLLEALTETKDIITKELHIKEEVLSLKIKTGDNIVLAEKDCFFTQLLKGMTDESYIFKEIDRLDLQLKQQYYIPVLLEARDKELIESRYLPGELNHIRLNTLKIIDAAVKNNARGEAFITSNFSFCILINDINTRSCVEIKNRLIKITEEIREKISDLASIDLIAAVGPQIKSLLNFDRVFKIGKDLFNYRVFNTFTLVFYEDISFRKKEMNMDKIKNIMNNFKAMLSDMNAKDADDILKMLFMGELKQSMDLNAYRLVSEELFHILSVQLDKYDMRQDFNIDKKELDRIKGIEQVYIWFSKLAADIITRARSQNYSDNRIISKVIEYIRKCYNEEVNLETAALRVNISKIYLSKLFKKETGENFIDFLTRVRIEKAKELLLNSRRKMEDISPEVGFGNSKYFSWTFKRATGFTPQEFRKSVHRNLE